MEQKDWGITEWKAHAKQQEKRFLEALDGWGKTIKELETHAEVLAQQRAHIDSLLEDRNHALSMFGLFIEAAKIASTNRKQRSKGRQHKRQPGELYPAYQSLERHYLQACKTGKSPSVKNVLFWTFQQQFKASNAGAWRLDDPTFKTKLRSLEKRISEDRTYMRVNFPKQGGLLG